MCMMKLKPKTRRRVAIHTRGMLRRYPILVNCGICVSLIGRRFPSGVFLDAPVQGRPRHYEVTFRRTRGNRSITVVYDKSTKICKVTKLVFRVKGRCPSVRVRIIPKVATTSNKTTILNTPLVRSFTMVDLDSLLAP